ncbi:hypothetical protein [Arthrobacter sp. ov118]|uniref:hypothetical protein n=1 Tax=Arthrobacter sp. ov118 TaxID=1761747 RepID=UPI0008E1A245|nr:hypothetical protein [Arthrobacter sp. ov118]SFT78932.1 hypothetical protein SAMN04487915_103257 [Arthrobacter sp. ov118]
MSWMVAACVKGFAQEAAIRIKWSTPRAAEIPWYATEVPTVFVSLNQPNHLIDVPMVKQVGVSALVSAADLGFGPARRGSPLRLSGTAARVRKRRTKQRPWSEIAAKPLPRHPAQA